MKDFDALPQVCRHCPRRSRSVRRARRTLIAVTYGVLALVARKRSVPLADLA
jgi:hypothetical protein